MKKIGTVFFALMAGVGIVHAGNGNTQTLSKARADASTSILAQAANLPMTGIGSGQNPSGVVSAAICEAGSAGIVIHDDGEADNAYGWNPASANLGRYADKFTPAAYPATIDSVCLAFVTNEGVTSFNFDVVVYADDGVGGVPGSVLGSKSFVGHPDTFVGVPFTPIFESFDVSGLGLDIVSRSVFISVEWDVMTERGIYLAADESAATPMAGGYAGVNADPWVKTQSLQANYRALSMRAVMPGNALFCSGFELGEDGACDALAPGDIVLSGPINHAIQSNIDGTSVNWITGDVEDADVPDYHFNPYNNSVRLGFWWNTGAPDIAGVSALANTSDYLVLQSGALVGPASVWSTINNPGPEDWAAGADGYLGFRFNCSSLPAPPASGICYGYVHLKTTAPNGFPATILDYAYDKRGAAISIP